MSYQVQLGTNASISYANVSAIASASVVYAGFCLLGDALNGVGAATSFQVVTLYTVGNSDLSVPKAALTYKANYGNFVMVDSSNQDFATDFHSGLSVGGFSNTTYYDCYFIIDTVALGGSSWFFAVYDQGFFQDSGHEVAHWGRSSGSPTITTAAGTGCVFVGNSAVGTFGVQQTYDWVKAGVDSTVASLDSTLEEGSGSSVSPSGTINGTFSWLGSSPSLYPARFVRQQTFARRRR